MHMHMCKYGTCVMTPAVGGGGRGFVCRWFSLSCKRKEAINKQTDGVIVMIFECCSAPLVFVVALDMISHAGRQFANDFLQLVWGLIRLKSVESAILTILILKIGLGVCLSLI